MKGISVWMWVIGGIIAGLVMFTLFVQIMSYVVMGGDKENAKAAVEELAAAVNGFCDARVGEKSERTVAFPNSVNAAFASKDGVEFKEGSSRTFGKFLCIEMGKEMVCERLNCELEMSIIKQESDLSWMDKVFGSSYHEHQLEVAKTEYGVSVLRYGMTSERGCTSLIACDGNTVAAYFEPNIIALADFTPIYNCCDESTTKFLKNTANFLKGSRILMIWEGLSFGPKLPENTEMINKLEGFSVDSSKHMEKITSSKLQNYDQVWIFVPGFCSVFDWERKTVECNGVIDWGYDEIGEMAAFVERGGKLLLVSDYTPYTTQSVVNDILIQSGYSSSFNDGCSCGCEGRAEKVQEITNHVITGGIDSLIVMSGADIIC